MKFINQIILFVVGALFVFSGMVKAIDPIGTAIKLEEYFEVFALDVPALASVFHFFAEYARELAIIFVVSEVVLGLALLLNFKRKTTIWLLFLMISFFTFLTFYSAHYNKVTDCGCFGDFIKLEPWQSFYKDIILLALILVLLFQIKKFKNSANFFSGVFLVLGMLCAGYFTFHGIWFEPYVDFRAYAIGKNIPEQMQPQEPPRYIYIMEKDGQEVRLEEYPTDASYKYVGNELLNEEESKPKIIDYSLWNDEGDFTKESLQGKRIFLLVQKVATAKTEKIDDLKRAIGGVIAEQPNVQIAILTSDTEQSINQFKRTHNIDFPFYYIDATVLKTIARSNPALWVLQDGTVKGKYSPNDADLSAESIIKSLE